jgi:MSHA biogenesis protein MshK
MNWLRFPAQLVVMAVLFTWHDRIVAQDLVDPTRPPASLSSAPDKAGGAPRLESIIVRGGKRTAIVSGEVVGPGDKVGDAVVERISDTAVLLRTGTRHEVLQLYPDLKKTRGKDDKTPGNEATTTAGVKKATRKQ